MSIPDHEAKENRVSSKVPQQWDWITLRKVTADNLLLEPGTKHSGPSPVPRGDLRQSGAVLAMLEEMNLRGYTRLLSRLP
jgi:hypothetical protein